MYAAATEPQEVKALFSRAHDALSRITEIVCEDREPVLIPRTTNLYEEEAYKGKVFVLTEGNLLWCYGENDLFILEPGDIVGLTDLYGIQIGYLRSEFAVKAHQFTADEFFGVLNAHPEIQSLWGEFLSCHYAAMTWFVISLMQGEKIFVPKVLQHKAGEVILEQGSKGTDVYTLLQGGEANVMVDGVKVGEIKEGELFGLFAALTDSPRTASIVASSDCLTVVVAKEDFLDLIRNMPDLARKAMADMARSVVELNSKVVSLSQDQGLLGSIVQSLKKLGS